MLLYLVKPKPCEPRKFRCAEGIFTDERLKATVSLFMGLQMPLSDETDATLLTRKGLLTGMRAYVCLKISNLRKVLHAVTEGTDEDLGIAPGASDLPDVS